MEKTFSSSGRSEWTLADFLSTYRFWALFLSSLLVTLGGHGMGTVLPMLMSAAASSYQNVGIFYMGVTTGWLGGAFVAFVVASRLGRPALIAPIVVCIVIAIALMPLPSIWSSPFLLAPLGLASGTVQAVFPLATAIFLVGGRPGKTDFGCALVLVSAPVLVTNLAPMAAFSLFEMDQSGILVLAGFVACLAIAALLLLPARDIGFDGAPRPRHRPLEPRHRSPLIVAAVLLAPPILVLVIGLLAFATHPDAFYSGAFPPLFYAGIVALAVVSIAAFIYLLYWVYRIHGELAGAASSQRLLTPVSALLITLFVPLGLPVLLVTLADLINDRTRDSGRGQKISIVWLAIWIVFLMPIAIAIVQNAANESYINDSKAE